MYAVAGVKSALPIVAELSHFFARRIFLAIVCKHDIIHNRITPIEHTATPPQEDRPQPWVICTNNLDAWHRSDRYIDPPTDR